MIQGILAILIAVGAIAVGLVLLIIVGAVYMKFVMTPLFGWLERCEQRWDRRHS